MSVLPASAARFTRKGGVVVVGAGAAGLCAALAARENGADVIVLERDPVPRGTTAMSIGFIPAAQTRFQRAKGIADSPEDLATDILAKSGGDTDRAMVARLCAASAATVEWLADRYGVPFDVSEKDQYPGHGKPRMHGTPQRTGAELMSALVTAAQKAGVDVVTNTAVTDLFADHDGRVHGVRTAGGDVGCDTLVLATCGFAGNHDLLARYIPEIANARFYGHAGSQGDAVRWGDELSAALSDMNSYQSHGGMTVDAEVPVPWAHILRGGVQVNCAGLRFSDETKNYAQRALEVLAQPGGYVWSIYDAPIDAELQTFAPYREVVQAGVVLSAESPDELCRVTGLPPALKETLREIAASAATQTPDSLGRTFGRALAPPFKAVKVTGVLYHTQGGLVVDGDGRVQRKDGTPFPNLYAAGGAARGVSGPGCEGYLGGNGLLTATVLGRFAGAAAARRIHG